MEHYWITNNGQDPLYEQEFDERLNITEHDVKRAISKLTLRATVSITAKLKRKLNQSRQRIKSRSISVLAEGK